MINKIEVGFTDINIKGQNISVPIPSRERRCRHENGVFSTSYGGWFLTFQKVINNELVDLFTINCEKNFYIKPHFLNPNEDEVIEMITSKVVHAVELFPLAKLAMSGR